MALLKAKRQSRLHLSIRVSPGVQREQLIRDGTALKIRLTAVPEGGAANQALIVLLAARLGLPKRAVRITSGATSRIKVVEIDGVATLTELWERMEL